jgi:hypothetical protein
VLRRHGGDAHVDLGAANAQSGRAVLRQATLGNIEIGENFDARH